LLLRAVNCRHLSRFYHPAAMASEVAPIVISGPSGSGKSTLVKKLMAEYDGCFAFSVSHTTRKPRPGEEHGTDYYFVEREDMEKLKAENGFVEHAEFGGNMYGTSKKAISDIQSKGCICILDVDMVGVKSIKETDLKPNYLFVRPPSMELLEKRLRGRGTETEEAIQKRLGRAQADMDYGAEAGAYDHIIVNDDLETAYVQLKEILSKDLETIQKSKE